MPRSHLARRTLAVESLEDRSLMAGNVTASMAGSKLTIQGDGEANHVVMRYDRATQRFHLSGVATAGGATTINGQADPAAAQGFARVGQIQVALGDGDDTFEILNPNATDVVIARYFSIDTGSGDDAVILGRVGNATGNGPLASRVFTAAGMRVETGEGNDQIEIANLQVGGGLILGTGAGDDVVVCANEFTAGDAGEFSPGATKLFPLRVRQQLLVYLGEGDDELNLRHVITGGMLRVLDVGGASEISLHNANVNGIIDIDTAGQVDEVWLKSVLGFRLMIDTRAGEDDVRVEYCKLRSIDVKLGAEYDTLDIRNSITRNYCLIDGGAGGGGFTRGPGNVLRGLRVRGT